MFYIARMTLTSMPTDALVKPTVSDSNTNMLMEAITLLQDSSKGRFDLGVCLFAVVAD